MAFPGPTIRAALSSSIAAAGIVSRLGDRLFPLDCLHQSLSGAVPDCASSREAMLHAGERIVAGSVAMTFDRVRSTGGAPGPIHWSLLPRGRADGFAALCAAVRAMLAQVGIEHSRGNTAHMTLCYDAPRRLRSVPIAPVTWTLDEIRLVLRHDHPFHYETLASWPLAAVRRPEQLALSF